MVDALRVTGGDINEAACLSLSDGRRLFLKHNDAAPPDMFAAEAEGLSWLRATNTLRVPEVLAVHGARSETPWLLLEWIEPGPAAGDHDEALGVGLAALHGHLPGGYGFDRSNYIGTLPQSNEPAPGWARFYGENRLRPRIARAHADGLFDSSLMSLLDTLLDRLDDLVGPEEPPARLHGDLWRGNVHRSSDGAPVLIDPAVYGGHREVDLAMMRLFGGFSERVFDAYASVMPLAPEANDRVALYQLYPLLVHVNLFGASYVGQVERVVRAYVGHGTDRR